MSQNVILFDLGGVLVQLGEQLFPESWSTSDQPFRLNEWFSSATAHLFETGKIAPNEFLQRLQTDLKLDASLPEIELAFTDWLQGLYPGTDELLIRLADEYQLAILSNTNELHEPILLDEFDLKNKVNNIFLSHHMGIAKPNPDIFTQVAQELGVSAGEIIFFDDNQVNIESAREVGIQSHLIVEPEKLSDLLLSNPLEQFIS